MHAVFLLSAAFEDKSGACDWEQCEDLKDRTSGVVLQLFACGLENAAITM